MWVKAWPRLLACFLSVVLVGCGGTAPNDPESSGSLLSTGDPLSGSQDSGSDISGSLIVPDGSTVTPDAAAGSTKGPATDAGMQLPTGDLPSPGDDNSGENAQKSSGPTKPGGGGIEMPKTTPDSADNSSVPSPTDIQLASWTAIESHAKSTGKITVVDLWSTVCEPCVREFPGLVRLSKEMQNDVACIGVSVDYDGRKTRPPEFFSERVGLFLSSVGADFDNYVCNTPSDDVFAEMGLPSIPAVLVYNAEGKLVKQFVDAGETIGFSYESDVIPFVEKLAG